MGRQVYTDKSGPTILDREGWMNPRVEPDRGPTEKNAKAPPEL